MNYEDFNEHDFALDPYFNEWVKSPTKENSHFWELWVSEHSEKKEQVEIARELILAIQLPTPQLSQTDLKQLWENIQQRNKVAEHDIPDDIVIPIHSKFKWFSRVNIAASISLLIAFSALFWLFKLNKNPEMVRYQSKFGEIKMLTLPDSSKVFLNANSTLTFAQHWDESADRKVELTGEAFFEVTKKPGKGNAKFAVYSDGVQVEVLGTKFNVYNRRSKINVVLQEGSVQLSVPGQNHKVHMRPGDLIEYAASNSRLNRTHIDPSRYSSWINHELIFDETPLIEVARSIEDLLNLKIDFEDESIKKLPFTGTLSIANPNELIVVLSKSFNIKTTRSGNRISFHH
ncbi:FecR family protein [Dyadobacter sp. CY323]|uniref:FecR family protein n=1 Tax=Dyadobacter sp. CY323 TaxID=2907302 RepID=UPI001F3D4C33|nr:FecR domain-containing protein [Dyadobacter sp. CY323]MCE6989775.1 FecR domain-containing protein [Dyadobacter sp. CY323]